jgi:hypothetical protein
MNRGLQEKQASTDDLANSIQKIRDQEHIFCVLHLCNTTSNDDCLGRFMNEYGIEGNYKVDALTLNTLGADDEYDLIFMNCVQKFNNPKESLRF